MYSLIIASEPTLTVTNGTLSTTTMTLLLRINRDEVKSFSFGFETECHGSACVGDPAASEHFTAAGLDVEPV